MIDARRGCAHPVRSRRPGGRREGMRHMLAYAAKDIELR